MDSEVEDSKNNGTLKTSSKVPKIGIRHAMTVLLHTFLLTTFLTRSTLSLALEAIKNNGTSSNPDIPTYNWTDTSVIQSSFYYSYVIFQPFSGYLFIKFGLKWVILTATLLNIGSFMLIPLFIAQFGSTGLIACRLVQGLMQGFCYPAIHHSLGLWIPKSERSILTMIARAGNKTGYIIGYLIVGFLSKSWWGWPSVFYLLGSIGLVWCVFWIVFAEDSPATHKSISEAEREFIEHGLETKKNQNIRSVPFLAIFSSLPFWAIAVANAGISWCYTVTDTYMPTYLADGLGLDIAMNGVVNAAMNAVQLCVNTPLALFGDYWVKNNHISLHSFRKLTQGIGSYVPAMALIWLAFVNKEQLNLAYFLLYSYSGIEAIVIFGSLVNHIDLSPKYAGVLMSIENTIAQIIAMFGPLLIGKLLANADVGVWKWILISLAGVMIVTSTFFIVFAKTEIQWWNSYKNDESTADKSDLSNAPTAELENGTIETKKE